MFRLLSILLVIYFSSPGDGAPSTIAVKPGQNNNGNQFDLILGEENPGKTDALALAADGTPGAAPSLKTRELGGSKAGTFSALKSKLTKKSDSDSSVVLYKPKGRKTFNAKYVPSTRYSEEDSSFDWDAELSESEKKKDAAKALVNALRRILPKRESKSRQSKSMCNKIKTLVTNQKNNLNEDEILAELMDKAIVMYDSAYGRDWRGLDDLAVDDKEGRVRRLVEEMYDIFDDLDTRDEIIPELTPEICEYWRKFNRTSPSQRRKDDADAFVRETRRIIGNAALHEEWNYNLPALMEAAITQYNNAYGRDRPSLDLGTMDKEAYIKLLTDEMNNVFDHYDSHARPVTLGTI